jgi:GNAT superfamily N-acetyltransferase
VLALLPRAGLHLYRALRRPLGAARRLHAADVLRCRALSLAELLPLCADPELDLREAMVRDAATRGDLCIGAWRGEALAGYAWFAYAEAPHLDGVWVRVPAEAVYRYKVLVRPGWRRRGVAGFLYAAADPLVARPGRGFVVTCIAAHNGASIAASLKSGDAPLGWIAYGRFSNYFLPYHDRLVRESGPRFYLRREGSAESAAASRRAGRRPA